MMAECFAVLWTAQQQDVEIFKDLTKSPKRGSFSLDKTAIGSLVPCPPIAQSHLSQARPSKLWDRLVQGCRELDSASRSSVIKFCRPKGRDSEKWKGGERGRCIKQTVASVSTFLYFIYGTYFRRNLDIMFEPFPPILYSHMSMSPSKRGTSQHKWALRLNKGKYRRRYL